MSVQWQPSATIAALRARAAIIAELRKFFAEREVLEVSTPIMSSSGPRDVHLNLVQASFGASDRQRFWLQPSPESAMKRLLAAGSGAIYQIGPALRCAERGVRHNPEFTMLEWYRPGLSLPSLMDEVDALLARCLKMPPGRRASYCDEFTRNIGIDPLSSPDEALRHAATGAGLADPRACNRNELLDFLFCARVEPALGAGIVHVHGFPPQQAAMARIENGLAQRVEVYVNGLELANGYWELGDEAELRRRFESQGAERARRGQDTPPMDEPLLSAMRSGLPEMCGIALGVDRLVMLALGANCIDEVIAFPLERA